MRIYRVLTRVCVLVVALIQLGGAASAEAWKFGVMGDTQWTTSDPAMANPATVPVSIIDQVNRQFIKAGVKFVIQVGDLTDSGNDISEAARAAAAQPLIDAGIGFFPFRGNHETNGANNAYGIPGFQSNYPQTRTGIFTNSGHDQYSIGSGFSSPTDVSPELAGMSYSFDYGDKDDSARMVIIDTWATTGKLDKNPDGYMYGYTVDDQQGWISSRLDRKKRGTRHAFVFSHQPLIAEGHQDTMFSGYANAHPEWQNRFFASLQDNGVRYFGCGHDHIHQRSIITSPDGKSRVQEIISASNSSKFYTPKPLDDPKWFGQKVRETSISQERNTVGYYIYTVDGPGVTVDYYSDDHGNWQSDANYPQGAGMENTGMTPMLHFVKKESWSYNLNGREYLVSQGASYGMVRERFKGTVARILDGTNNSLARDASYNTTGGEGRPLTKAVDTGWFEIDFMNGRSVSPKSDRKRGLASNIFTLRGMADFGREEADVYVLAMSYDPARFSHDDVKKGLFGLVVKNSDGTWINAVDKNFGGVRRFVKGPWVKGYALGSYGIDSNKKIVWAVINSNGDYAVAGFAGRSRGLITDH
ncbi:MAG: metallophosphoesterase [Chlorobiaceae bacterium]|nr:metallophosphoesterase [Chlorobiaceae bacterium]